MSALKDLSALIRRSGFFGKFGQTFGGTRDLYTVLGYKQDLKFDDFYRRYVRQDIAQRVVDAPADGIWQDPPVLDIDDFEKLALKLKLWHYLNRADKLSGIGSYGVLLIGTGQELTQPLLEAKEILFLSPFHEDAAKVSKLDDNPMSPRFGQPEVYEIDMSSGVTVAKQSKIMVHHSHIIHIADNLGIDEIFGRPRLEAIFNRLDDIEKITGGSAEMFWLGAYRGLQADIDKDMDLDPTDEKQLSDEINEYVHGLRRFVRTKGITLTPLVGEIADPRGAFKIAMDLISGTTGIPQRILLGVESGELASSQDEKNWKSRLSTRQTSFAEPIILRPLIDRFIQLGILPKEDYIVKWPDLMALTEAGRADIAARVAQAIRNIAAQGSQQAPTTVVTVGEFRKKYLGIEEELINESRPPVADADMP